MRANQPLDLHQKLASYYLDVLSSEITEGISVFASSRYGFPDYALIESGNPIASEGSPYNSNWVRDFINKRKGSTAINRVALGYPNAVKEFTSKKGNTFYVVIPIFLIPYQDESWKENNPRLDFSATQLNIKAVSEFEREYNQSSLLTSFINLNEDLGLYRDVIPSLSDLLNSLRALKNADQQSWPWREELIPEDLSYTNLSQMVNEGIYNSAALFGMPEQQYTKGLEKELQEIRKLSKDQIKGTALHDWVYGIDTTKATEVDDLLAPIALNEEQASAIEKSLRGPLSVVTGPPGTGKSQLVTGLITNAAMQGQKILFASKNNKAVDVVAERINNITNRAILIRLGNLTHQQSVVDSLNLFLSDDVNQADVDKYQNLKKRLKAIKDKIAVFDRDIRWYIDKRNEIEETNRQISQLSLYFYESVQSVLEDLDERYVPYWKQEMRYLHRRVQMIENGQVFFKKFAKKRLTRLSNYFFQRVEEIGNFKLDENPEEAVERTKYNLELLSKLIKLHELIQKYQIEIEEFEGKPLLEDIYLKRNQSQDQFEQISLGVYESWLKTLPKRISKQERTSAANFLTLLKMIMHADEDGSRAGSAVFAKYYQELERLKNVFYAWAITSLSVRRKIPFKPHMFDIVVIDEASQCDIASAIPMLYRAKKAVVIGDGKQLQHISLLRKKMDMGLMAKHDLIENHILWSYSQNSLYDLAQGLVSEDMFTQLRDHHRSHSDIITFSNQAFYGENLRIFTKYEQLNLIPNKPVVRWIDAPGLAKPHYAGGTYNPTEAGFVVKELKRLVENSYTGSIGVVSPFRAQVNHIKEQLHRFPDLEAALATRDFLIDTVHRFQGDERDVMIFSPTIAKGVKSGSVNFLKNSGNLFNVAITRARAALITIGDKAFCSKSGVDYLEKFIQYIDDLDSGISNSGTQVGDNYGGNITEQETTLYEALLKVDLEPRRQEPAGPYFIDLALEVEERKLAIEVDGKMYHQDWDGEYLRRDMMKNHRLIELGWDVMRFWNYQIEDHLEECVERVLAWMKENY